MPVSDLDADAALLGLAMRLRPSAADAEEGRRCCEAALGTAIDAGAFAASLSRLLAKGLIRDPVRLSEGDLHCHFVLEATPAGIAAAPPAG